MFGRSNYRWDNFDVEDSLVQSLKELGSYNLFESRIAIFLETKFIYSRLCLKEEATFL